MDIKDYKKKWESKKFNNSFSEQTVVSYGCEVVNSNMGYCSRIKPSCQLRDSNLGDYSIVSNSTYISATDIGKFDSIGYGNYIGLWEHNLYVTTHSFYLYETSGGFVKGYKNYEKDEIRTKICNDVWTGANVVILKGVCVGDGAIVGAGSVVTKDVPPYAIVVGNPARKLRYRFSKADIEYLLHVKWWNLKKEIIQDMTDKNLWDSLDRIKNYLSDFGC